MSRPRLGFLGLGWIGRLRLEALLKSGTARVVALADSAAAQLDAAHALVPSARRCGSLEELLESSLDGVVIATPSALHAEQATTALEHGMAVFCQKPLARTAEETRRVVEVARAADRLLDVDFCYRWVRGVGLIRDLVRAGELGELYAADLVFHNAYGPDKPWFYDPALSGGGCVMDLGIHLVDLTLWMMEPRRVERVTSQLYAGGRRLDVGEQVEDFALATLELSGGAVARLACSWNLSAGCDAVIQATFFGTKGTAALQNVAGSFFDFRAERLRGTSREVLDEPPDDWGGRALSAWADRVAADGGFDPAAEELIEVASVIDAIYGRAHVPSLELA